MRPIRNRRTAWMAALCIVGVLAAWGDLGAQPTREEVVAHLSKQYGRQDAERMYEEMLIRETVERFTARINRRDIVSLAGALEEDSVTVVPVDTERPVSGGSASVPPASSDSGRAGDSTRVRSGAGDTSRVWPAGSQAPVPASPSVQAVKKVEVRWGPTPQRVFATTSDVDYSVEERKALRKDLLTLFNRLPFQVQIPFEIREMRVNGSVATVEMAYRFRALEFETPASLRLTQRPPAQMALRLRKVGEGWLVEDVRGIAEQMAAAIR